MSQPQYLIVANKNCKTHKEGTLITYTGSRYGIAQGWTILYRVKDWFPERGVW